MLTDELRNQVWGEVRRRDCRAFQKFLQPQIFTEAAAEAGVGLGASALSKVALVWLGIAAALHAARSFASVLTATFRLLEDVGDLAPRQNRQGHKRASRHAPCPAGRTNVTEEAFVQARRRMPLAFWQALLGRLAARCQQEHQRLIRWKQFRLLALDGSHINLPHWKALAEHFGTAKTGHAQSYPQARMVLLQLPLIRLPMRGRRSRRPSGFSRIKPAFERSLTFCRRLSREQIGDTDILVQARPMNTAAVADQTPVRPFLSGPVREARIPGRRNGDRATVRQLHRHLVIGDLHVRR